MKTSNFKVRALECGHCAEEVGKTLEAQPGVRLARVRSGDPGAVAVEFDESHTSEEYLVAVLRREGYDAELAGRSAGNAP